MGDQTRTNHVGCASGEDKKRRLYIKKTDRGLVAYCHHCNDSGFVFDGDSRVGTWLKDKTPVDPHITTIPVLSAMSMEGRMWLAKYYCVPDVYFNGVRNEPKKIALTLLSAQGETIGVQVRNLVRNAVPKYITSYCNSTYKGESSWFYDNPQTLVITEDYLSAYRVNRDAGVSSVALLRTSVSDTTLRQIHDLNFEVIHIWLDSDQAGLEGATKAAQKLRHYLPFHTIVDVMHIDKEPKEHTKEELRGLLHSSSGL